jgi:hypothetical protein
MYRKHAIRAGAATLGAALTLGAAQLAATPTAVASTAHAAVAALKVTVTVKGKTKLLLPTKTVQLKSGWITRGGAPTGKCSATSAQGALNVATHGNWKGTWYSSYHEYYITGILGDSETTKKYYWGLYVNGKMASKGACDIKLKTGDKVLFKVTKS